MSATINVRGNLSASDDIPYTKYFELCSYENWSLHHYVSLIIDNFKFAEKDKAHQLFFNSLHHISNNLYIPQEARDIAQKLIKNRKVSIFGIINKFGGAILPGACTYWIRLVGAMQVLKWVRLLDSPGKHHGIC